jgi:hypothetical protein
MFGQLLPNKKKIATVWRDIYYADLGSKLCDLNLEKGEKCIVTCFGFIWQIVSNHWLIRFKTFVSQSTTKMYN